MKLQATIDYSPNPSATDMTIVLEEKDLEQAKQSQYERFLRVWVTDRKIYAPKLHTLVIELCSEENEPIVGITRFLQYYQSIPYDMSTTIVSCT